MSPSDTLYLADPYKTDGDASRETTLWVSDFPASHAERQWETAVLGDREVGNFSSRVGFDYANTPVSTQDDAPSVSPRPTQSETRRSEDGNGAEAVVESRITLLARRYAEKTLPREQSARLEVLTEKMLRMIPAATVEDYEALGSVIDRAAQLRKKREASRARVSQL